MAKGARIVGPADQPRASSASLSETRKPASMDYKISGVRTPTQRLGTTRKPRRD
jgi:hypothetical protein